MEVSKHCKTTKRGVATFQCGDCELLPLKRSYNFKHKAVRDEKFEDTRSKGHKCRGIDGICYSSSGLAR